MSARSRLTDLDALGERYGLSAAATARIDCLLAALEADPHAPTALRARARALDDHVADSLVGLELPVVRAAHRLADLGSGAGFPGLPLAVALPRVEVVLVESSGRKCAFLERTATACGLVNVRVACARAEEAAARWPGAFDLVVARALAPLSVVVEYAAPLLRIGGTLVAWRGRRDPEAEASAAAAAEQLGLVLSDVVPVAPYPGVEARHLHLLTKTTETPARFPRRPGMALKRPLGR